MSHRIPTALVLALALSGCVNFGGAGTGGKVPMQTKVTKVSTITKTFSFSKNTGLQKAAMSVKELTTALQGAFSAAPSGAAMTPRTSRYALQEGLLALRAAGMRATYKISGVADYGDAKLIYNDETGEVTAIEGKNAKVTFEFVNKGNTRTWDAVIVKAPDGTTGKFHIEVTAGWRSINGVGVMTPVVAATPPAAINDNGTDSELVGPNAEEMMPDVPTYTPPPYKWFNNEMPETVDVVTFTLEVVPKGDASLAFKMSGTFDEPENVPGSTARVPTHWKYKASIPKVAFDWESNLDLIQGRSRFTAKGTMNVDGDQGKDQFTYAIKADEQARAASFEMTNVNAKVKLLLAGSQPNQNAQPKFTSELISTEDNAVIGTVAMDPKRPRFAIITFKADNTTMDWELYPEGLLPQSPQMAAPPPSFEDRGSLMGYKL